MIGRHDLQRSGLQAGPQRLPDASFGRNGGDITRSRRMVPVRVAVFVLVEQQVLDQRFAKHPLARGAGPRDRVVGVAAGGVDDIERTACHVGDHDRAVGGFAFDGGRPRIGVTLGPRHAGAEIVLLQAPDDVAVLGMHQRHRSERRAAQKRVVELVVIDHQGALVRHEMLERVDAVGFDASFHLVEHLLVPPGDRHVKAVVASGALCLAAPVLIGREQ